MSEHSNPISAFAKSLIGKEKQQQPGLRRATAAAAKGHD
jgi:hypothetical protein